jgi:hypothetical protein
MKTKSITLFPSLLVLTMLLGLTSIAQQGKYNKPAKTGSDEQLSTSLNIAYTFRVFTAPNKTYGYDILQNERLVFRLPAMPRFQGDENFSITTQKKAEMAATLTIIKIKRGMSPQLSKEELIKIAAH